MPNYLSDADVADAGAGGRLTAIWSSMSPTAQESYLAAVTSEVDDITEQDGGLFSQTGKTVQIVVDQYTDSLHLPNSPILRVSAIHIEPPANGAGWDLVCTDGVTIRRSGGCSFRYVTPPGFLPPYAQPQPGAYPFWEGLTVTVTYDCGYAELPQGIKLPAAMLLAARLLQIQDAPGGAQEARQGRSTVVYGRTVIANVARMEADGLLDRWKVRRF